MLIPITGRACRAAHALDQVVHAALLKPRRLISAWLPRQPEHPRLWIARLWPRRDGAQLDEPKRAVPRLDGLAVLVEAAARPTRLRNLSPSNSIGACAISQRNGAVDSAGKRANSASVRRWTVRVEREQGASGQP